MTEPRQVDHIGTGVRVVRAYHGMSQQEMAKAIGVSPSYLCLVEHEKRTPSLEVLGKVAKATGVPVSKMLSICEEGL